MKLSLQRKLDFFLGVFICRLLSLFNIKRKRGTVKSRSDKILIILFSEIGSLILAYPMFERIKKKFPNSSIHTLLFEKNREVLEIMKTIPTKNILTISNASFIKFVKDSISVLLKMRKNKFDIVIDCELFSRISSIFSFLSKAPIRVGFHPYTQEGLYRGNFINRPVLYNPYQHISQQFITLAEAINSETVPKAKREVTVEKLDVPSIVCEQSEIKNMLRRLTTDFSDVTGKELVLIQPSGGELPVRAWPLDYFCRVSKELISREYAIGVIGLHDDKELASKILSHCDSKRCIDLTGYTKSIRELITLFHLASLLIANDGGSSQLAALTPIPTIIFYGPETPKLYRTFDENAEVFYTPLSCSPCLTAYNHRNSPCDGDNKCLKSIHPDRVIEKALEMLGRKKVYE